MTAPTNLPNLKFIPKDEYDKKNNPTDFSSTKITINGRDFTFSALQVRPDAGSDWQKVSIDKLDPQYQTHLARVCQEIFENVREQLEIDPGATKISIVFNSQLPPSGGLRAMLLNVPVIGRLFGKEPLTPNPEIAYLQTKNNEEEEIEIDFDKNKFDTKDLEILNAILEKNQHLIRNLHNPYYLKSNSPSKKSNKTTALHKCIQEAGKINNKCLALSVAKQELKNQNLEAIMTTYGLKEQDLQGNWENQTSEKKTELLSEALINKAAENILTEPLFLADDLSDSSTQPSFGILGAALKNMNYDLETGTPDEKVQARAYYANKIQEKGEMLDLPFLIALKKPFIILGAVKKNLKILAFSQEINLKTELKNVVCVYYNGTNHYQSVILDDDAKEELHKMLNLEAEERQECVKKAMLQPTKTEISLKKAILDAITLNLDYKYEILNQITNAEAKQHLSTTNDPIDFAQTAAQALIPPS